MTPSFSRTLILLAACWLCACSSVDSFLEAEIRDTPSIALAKPIVPGYNADMEEPVATTGEATDPKSAPQQAEVPEITNSSQESQPALLPPPLSTKEEVVAEQKEQAAPQTESVSKPQSPSPDTSPSRRVPSTTGFDPCNEVHQAMISSMQREIEDLQSYYDEITDIIERHSIMKEVREKKKDLQKYKRDHGCK